MTSPSQQAFGRHVGITQQAVSDMVQRGILTEGGSLEEWRLAYCNHLRNMAAGRAMGASEEAMAAEKLRLTTAQADKTEQEAEAERLKVEVLRKTLIPESVIKDWFGNLVANARAKLLSIPSKAASLVIAASDRQEAEAILKGLVYEALDELAKGEPEDEAASVPDSGDDLEPAPEPDRKRVGRKKPDPKPRKQQRARKV